MQVKKFPFILAGSEINTSKRIKVKFPYTGEEVFQIAAAQKNDVEDALRCAGMGFRQAREMTTYERAEVLLKVSQLIKENQDDLVETIILEAGKPRKYAVAEVRRATQTFRFAAEVLQHYEGKAINLDLRPGTEGKKGIIQRFPLGRVFAITPFNFPLNLVAHKYAPAIMAGNCIIHKPASKTPITAYKLAKLVLLAGYPSKAVSMLPMSSKTTSGFLSDPRIKAVTFTGSAEVGWRIKQKAYDKKVLLELGGDAAAIVCKDTKDWEKNAELLAMAALAYAGQVCISLQRLYIHESIYDTFKEIFLEKIKNIPKGDPRDEGIIMGSMIDKTNADRIMNWVEDAIKKGANPLLKPERLSDTFVTPAVLENVPADAILSQEEAFAPYVAIEKFSTLEEAVKKVNSSKYGLQASIFTQSIDNIKYAYNNIKVGGLIVNFPPTFRVDNMPYGGVKKSGYGREGLKYSYEELSEMKLLVL